MNNYKRLSRITLIIIHILILALAVLIVILPFAVQWYAETMGRSSKLATVIMLTCYPCSPFAAYALLSLRKLMINVSKSEIFIKKNFTCLNAVAICCLIAGIIMAFAGTQYMPFYISAGAAIFCSLIILVCKSILLAVADQKEDIKENIKE